MTGRRGPPDLELVGVDWRSKYTSATGVSLVSSARSRSNSYAAPQLAATAAVHLIRRIDQTIAAHRLDRLDIVAEVASRPAPQDRHGALTLQFC
jgi:hypothetical protein